MFETPQVKVARPLIVLKTLCLTAVSAYVVLGLTAGYRAYNQVHSVNLESEPIIKDESVIKSDVVTYARVPVTLRLELVQGAHEETVAVYNVPKNEWAFLDPRIKSASYSVTISREILNKFAPGPATIRATATGRSQLTRLPPPVVREVSVKVQ